MAVEVLDTLGMKCPQPILKIAVRAPDMKPGDILEILGDCPTFEKDVRIWCERLGKVFLSVKDEGGDKKANPDTVLKSKSSQSRKHGGLGPKILRPPGDRGQGSRGSLIEKLKWMEGVSLWRVSPLMNRLVRRQEA